MSFFYNIHGNAYPISRVRRIIEAPTRHSESSPPFVRVELDEGDSTEVYESDVERLKQASGPVLPAAPGTYVLHYVSDDGGDLVGRDAVIGWSVGSGHAVPIVVDTEFDGMRGNMAYLLPDGKIYSWSGQSWDTEADWCVHQRQSAEPTASRRNPLLNHGKAVE